MAHQGVFEHFLHTIQGPEFWMSLAFFAVIVIAFRPLKKRLHEWGKQRKAEIQETLDEPVRLRRQAEALLEKYETHTKNRDAEYAEIIKKAEEEIDFLQADFDTKLKERLERKEKETAVRLQMIRDNGVKEMENQMLQLVVRRTYELLADHASQKNSSKEIDAALESVYSSLKENTHLIRK